MVSKKEDLTDEEKRKIRYGMGVISKFVILYVGGAIFSIQLNYDILNYKKNTFTQFLLFFLTEEVINSWNKKDKEAKSIQMTKLTFSKPVNAEPGVTLNPGRKFPP